MARLAERIDHFNDANNRHLKLFTSTIDLTMTKEREIAPSEADVQQILSLVRNYDGVLGEGFSIALGLENGAMYTANSAELPDGYDPRVRPWYKDALKSGGEMVLSDAYQSAISPTDLSITYSLALLDKEGTPQGVAGLDVNLSPLIQDVELVLMPQDSQFIISDLKGQILFHKANGQKTAMFNTGFRKYQLDLPENRWKIYVYIPEKLFLTSQITVLLTTMVMLVIFISLSLYYAGRMDHRLIDPIDHYITSVNHMAKHPALLTAPASGDTQELSHMRNAVNAMLKRIMEQSETVTNQQLTLSTQYMEIEALYEESAAMNDSLNDMVETLNESWRQTIRALSNAIEANDEYTRGHCDRVTHYALQIANALALDSSTLQQLEFAAMLHDVGKIGVPHHILNKPSALSPEERMVVEKHPQIGYTIVKDVAFLAESSVIIRHHHEHFDGKGYPEGLSGGQIPLASRILCIADAFDAMTSARAYRRNPMTFKQALAELENKSGSQFDPQLVRIMVRVPLKQREGVQIEL